MDSYITIYQQPIFIFKCFFLYPIVCALLILCVVYCVPDYMYLIVMLYVVCCMLCVVCCVLYVVCFYLLEAVRVANASFVP